jgi:hypothetical protein
MPWVVLGHGALNQGFDAIVWHNPQTGQFALWDSESLTPTPGAVGIIIETIARRDDLAVVGVDIGGATTDVFSVFQGVFNRTVSANLGMSYSISNVMAEAGIENILRWVPFAVDEGGLRNRIKNKMIRPTTIPSARGPGDRAGDRAKPCARLRAARRSRSAWGRRPSERSRHHDQTESGASREPARPALAARAACSHARCAQAALMMVDAFLPEAYPARGGKTMAPQLGVLDRARRGRAQVFERDCLIRLGGAAPVGAGKPGQACVLSPRAWPPSSARCRSASWCSCCFRRGRADPSAGARLDLGPARAEARRRRRGGADRGRARAPAVRAAADQPASRSCAPGTPPDLYPREV